MTDRSRPYPFRFGVLAGGAPTPDAWRALARRVEDIGYCSLLFPDHLGNDWGPFTALTVAAEHTTALTLGTLVQAVDLRQPVVQYKELATLDLISGGRTEIGLGAGWFGQDFTRAGITMDPPATRIERLAEAAVILRELWTKGSCTFDGRHFSVAQAVGEPRPVKGDPLITMGGGGRLMLRTAARHADIVNLSASQAAGTKGSSFGATATAEHFDERARWIRTWTADRPAPPELQCLVFAAAITPDASRYAAGVLRRMFGLPAEQALRSPLALVGTVDEVCALLIERRERFGISYWVLDSRHAEQFAPVVESLVGT
ncbi:TIGR03621 family F420-dependent LLM class oxidoreductase [Streptomyces sp. NPDC026589]|uniref:TIGR03621 family F420-dependent LLM class oxidoreductase n=1 Tax=Streptomyces sp. NPDC026589 TaxID=3155609 RepID=UPI00340EE6ED